MLKKYRCYNIEWDTDGEEVDLPSEVFVEVDDEEPDLPGTLASKISDEVGFCHNAFAYEVVERPMLFYRWTATFETRIEVDDPTNVQEVRDRGADIDIPEDEYTEYQEGTFDVDDVTDEEGNSVPH